MPRLNASPNAEASIAFEVVKPGTYRLRILEITEFTAASGNTCWKVRFEYAEPSTLEKLSGGPASNPGNIFDNSLVVSPAEKQGKLRGFVEAAGLAWRDLESDELLAQEVLAKVGIEEYDGEQRNVVKRY